MLPWECMSGRFPQDVCGFQWRGESEHTSSCGRHLIVKKNAIQLCLNHKYQKQLYRTLFCYILQKKSINF